MKYRTKVNMMADGSLTYINQYTWCFFWWSLRDIWGDITVHHSEQSAKVYMDEWKAAQAHATVISTTYKE